MGMRVYEGGKGLTLRKIDYLSSTKSPQPSSTMFELSYIPRRCSCVTANTKASNDMYGQFLPFVVTRRMIT